MPTYVSSGNDHGRNTEPQCLDIGLVNNMPDAALAGTERQFLSLLEAASGSLVVRLTFYALPEVPRSDAGRRYISSYGVLGDLWDRPEVIEDFSGALAAGTVANTWSLDAARMYRNWLMKRRFVFVISPKLPLSPNYSGEPNAFMGFTP